MSFGSSGSRPGAGFGSKFGSFLNKAKDTAIATGQTVGAAVKEQSNIASSHTQTALQGFSLPGEAEKAANLLASFLDLPISTASNPVSPITSPGGSTVTDPISGAPVTRAGKFKQNVRRTGEELKRTTEGVKKGVEGFNRIPTQVVKNAKGFAIFTVIKAGFVFSGKAGSGLVVARLPDGSWSAPSCIATAGVGWGFQAGADITDVVVVLNSEDAVRAFSQGGNVQIGGQLSAAVGPVGTGAQMNAALQHPAPMFSYTRSRGLFAGVSLEGTVLVERKEANRQFYGSAVSAKDILSGHVPAPEIASKMYDLLEAAEELLPAEEELNMAFSPPSSTPAAGSAVLRDDERELFNADKH